MREQVWLRLRKSAVLRRFYSVPGLRQALRGASQILLPPFGMRRLRVKSGLGEGLVLELNPRWELPLWEGNYEIEMQGVFEPLLRPGRILYDIGGGIGFYSFVAAKRSVRVFAFEPDMRNANYIEEYARLNDICSQIKVIQKAVFSFTGEIALQPAIWGTSHGNATVDQAKQPAGSAIRVPCVTVDDFEAENSAPDLIKMDVEGAESEVLKGAERVFGTIRPDLLCEVHDEPNRLFVEAWLQSKEYVLRWLEESVAFPRHLFATAGDRKSRAAHD